MVDQSRTSFPTVSTSWKCTSLVHVQCFGNRAKHDNWWSRIACNEKSGFVRAFGHRQNMQIFSRWIFMQAKMFSQRIVSTRHNLLIFIHFFPVFSFVSIFQHWKCIACWPLFVIRSRERKCIQRTRVFSCLVCSTVKREWIYRCKTRSGVLKSISFFARNGQRWKGKKRRPMTTTAVFIATRNRIFPLIAPQIKISHRPKKNVQRKREQRRSESTINVTDICQRIDESTTNGQRTNEKLLYLQYNFTEIGQMDPSSVQFYSSFLENKQNELSFEFTAQTTVFWFISHFLLFQMNFWLLLCRYCRRREISWII